MVIETDIGRFLAATRDALEEREVENSMLLGNLEQLAAAPPAKPPFLARQGGFAALQAGGRLFLSAGPPACVEAVARALRERAIDPWAVTGPAREVEAFREAWTSARGCSSRLGFNQRLYQLTEVAPPQGVPGAWRPPRAEELPLLTAWIHAFALEALPGEPRTLEDSAANAARRLGDGMTYLWESGGEPVTVAALSRPTRRTITINSVYTPPERRGRGYASALTAALSEEGLRRGKTFCVLYTDLSNATTNSIYPKIGYKPVFDSPSYRFLYAPEGPAAQ